MCVCVSVCVCVCVCEGQWKSWKQSQVLFLRQGHSYDFFVSKEGNVLGTRTIWDWGKYPDFLGATPQAWLLNSHTADVCPKRIKSPFCSMSHCQSPSKHLTSHCHRNFSIPNMVVLATCPLLLYMCIYKDHVCVCDVYKEHWAVPTLPKMNQLSLIFTSRIKGLWHIWTVSIRRTKNVRWL